MRSKSVVGMLVCLAMLITASGCTLPLWDLSELCKQETTKGDEAVNTIDSSLTDFTLEGFRRVQNRHNYDALDTEELRKCYDAIGDSVFCIGDEKTDKGYQVRTVKLTGAELKPGEIRAALTAFFCDHPEVFWMDSSFEYLVYGGNTVIYQYSELGTDEVTEELRRLKSAVYEILSGVSNDMSEYDRELYIHDRLIELCTYDGEATHDRESSRSFSVLGALCDGKAVCEGYSRAFQLLLSVLGIESNCVYGSGKEQLHMWNSVKLGDKWYYTDVTWDDGDNGKTYAYFNISEEELAGSHTLSQGYRELPPRAMEGDEVPDPFNVAFYDCVDADMNYYRNSAVSLDGSSCDAENIKEAIKSKVQGSDDPLVIVYLYVNDERADYDDVVNNLFYGGEYLIFDCIDDVNTELYGVTVDVNGVSVITIERLCGINLFLELDYDG